MSIQAIRPLSSPAPATLGDVPMTPQEANVQLTDYLFYLAMLDAKAGDPGVAAEIARVKDKITTLLAVSGIDQGLAAEVTADVAMSPSNFVTYWNSTPAGAGGPVFATWLAKLSSFGYDPAKGGGPDNDSVFLTAMVVSFLEGTKDATYTQIADNMLVTQAGPLDAASIFGDFLNSYSKIPGNPSLSLLFDVMPPADASRPFFSELLTHMGRTSSQPISILAFDLDGVMQNLYNPQN